MSEFNKKRCSWVGNNSQKMCNKFNIKNKQPNQIKNTEKNIIINNNYKNEENILLSNANLNIINILNTCMSRESSFRQHHHYKPTINNKKDKSVSKSSKIKEGEIRKSKTRTRQKRNTSSSIFYLTGSDSYINSNISNVMKVYNEKEIMIEGKLLSKRDKTPEEKKRNLSRRSVNINTYHNYYNLMDNSLSRSLSKSLSKSNKRLKKTKSEKIVNNNNSSNKISSKLSSGSAGLFGQLSDIDMYKINENIHNEMNFINLKKKISKLKKRIERYSSKSLKKYGYKKESISPRKGKSRSVIVEDKKEISKNKSNYKSNIIKKQIPKEKPINNNEIRDKRQEKYRKLKHKKCLYDSIDDEEYDDEVIGFYLAPNSLYIIMFDILMLLSSMFYFIFLPYLLSINYFFYKDNNIIYKYIFFIIDIIYILDLINNFFRAFHTYDEHLIRSTRLIIIHYAKTWFLIDLIQAIPYYSIFYLLRGTKEFNDYAQSNQIIFIVLIIKIMKVYKIFNDNSTISSFTEIISKYEFIDDHGNMVVTVLILICCLNLTTCLFIFLGSISYPNWMIKINIQDESFYSIYLIALYFVIVTITTVGYGDIAGDSVSEIIFQILLLIVGTISYSFIISFISNYIVKSNQKSMTYEKNIEILREIKFNNPNMKDSIYKEVLRTLYNEQLFERKDKHLLFDCLSYSLKNQLIIEMYKPIIMNFIFFKDVYNSDFFIKVATSLKSLISNKGNILIQEGDFIKEIFFIKKGVVGLSFTIDLYNLEEMVKKYFTENEKGKNDRNILTMISKTRNSVFSYKSNFNSFFLNNTIKMDLNSEKESNIIEKSIIDIRKNEHFGDALMLLNERSPLIARVKTRTAELLILRKMEAIEIYSLYPNIWKKINKKSLYNMEQINQKIKKILIDLSNRNNVKIDKYLNKDNIINNFNKYNTNFKRTKSVIFTIDQKNKSKKRDSHNIKTPKSSNQKIDNKENENNFSEKLKLFENNKLKPTKSINSEENNKKNQGLFIHFNHNLDKSKSHNAITFKGEDENDNQNSLNKTKSNNLSSIIVKTNSFKIIDENEVKPKKKNNNFLELSFRRDSNGLQGNGLSLTKRRNTQKSNQVNELGYSRSINASFNSINNGITFKRKSLTPSKDENLLYNAFINLNLTKENSFQFKACYENINTISSNKYVNNKAFQQKVKQFVMKESMDDNLLGLNTLSQNMSQSIIISPSQNNEFQRLNTIKYDEENKSFKLGLLKLKQPIRKIRTKRSKNENKDFSHRSKSLTSNDDISKKLNLMNGIKRDATIVGSTNKIKRKLTKKKLLKVNKKLVTIRQNIQNTNNAINNPMEFYMNFFNDIIKKESPDIINNEEVEQKEFNLNSNFLSSS